MGSTAGPKERGEQREVSLPYSGSGPDNIKNKRNGEETLHCACFLKGKKKREEEEGG